jgi:TPR repeat protein
MYIKGEGVEASEFHALRFYRLAAEQGHAVAQYNAGLLLKNRRLYGEALPFIRASAEQNVAEAQTLLAAMYEKGDGVKKDEAEAAEWLRRAGPQGGAKP